MILKKAGVASTPVNAFFGNQIIHCPVGLEPWKNINPGWSAHLEGPPDPFACPQDIVVYLIDQISVLRVISVKSRESPEVAASDEHHIDAGNASGLPPKS
ncbi:hypothetical protein ACFL55_03220 [Candidatus Latescibacterota bacterium]